MFFFLLVVMVPKMNLRLYAQGDCFKPGANCLDRIPWTWRLHGRLVKRLGEEIKMDTYTISKKTWHSRGNQVETRRFERLSPVSTGVPGEWFGGHWWLLQSRGFSRGVWNLNAASPYFSMEKTQGKKPQKPEVAICPRGQWNEGRNLFLFGSDLALHDIATFFCLLPSVLHQQAPCFRSMRPGYLGAFPSDGCATWTLRFKTLTLCLPVPWYVLKQLKHIHFTQYIYIYTYIRIYTSMSSLQMYTSLGCYFGHLLHLSPGHMRIRQTFQIRSSKQDWWNEDII